MTDLAVVTGAGTGIGRAVAEELARRGLHVVLVGRTPATLEEVAKTIVAAGGLAETVAADVGVPSDVEGVLATVGDRPVAAVVHAAGTHIAKPFADTTWDDFDQQIAVNLAGPFFLTQGLAPRMVDGSGVVFISSIAAARAASLHAAYSASKAGLLGLTKQLAAELAPSVRVNCVSPGVVATSMLQAYNDASNAGLNEQQRRDARIVGRSRILLRRVAKPAEVAATVVHLAVEATAITGVDVAVDVGFKAS
jgi:3-oxoacyl-[acyl-carrier protein] reductase